MSTTPETKLTSLELRQQLSQVVADNKAIFAKAEEEKRDFQPEEEARFEANAQHAEELKQDINKAEKREYLEKQDAELNKPIRRITPEKASYRVTKRSSFNGAFRAWVSAGKCHVEDMRSAEEWGVNPHNPTLELRTAYGIDGTTVAAGEDLVPITLAQFILEAKKAFGGLAAHTNVIETATGGTLNIPDADYTAFTATAGISASTGNTFGPFGNKAMNSHLYRTNVIPVDVSLINDSQFDLQSYVGKMLGMGLARGQANDIVNGDTSGNQPRGLVTDTSVAVSGTAYTYAKLLAIVAALDPAYYANAKWLMSNQTWLAIAALVDGNQRPLLWNQLQALPGTPFSSNLLGFQVQIDQAMPSSTGNTTIVFGDLSYYQLRRVTGSLQLVRYMETFRQTHNAIGLEAQERIDGLLVGVGSNGPCIGFELLASS